MQQITGRLTANAQVRETKNNSKVVGFTVAINDSYRSKDKERVNITTYVDCSYWLNARIAEYLKKGTMVELCGRIGANAWVNRNGEAVANLTLHVNDLKLLGKSATNSTDRVTDNAQVATGSNNADDDLPF